MLTTDNQRKIVEEIHNKFQEYVVNSIPRQDSSTFVPFFDITLKDHEKGNLHEIPVSTLIKDQVKNALIKSSFKIQPISESVYKAPA